MLIGIMIALGEFTDTIFAGSTVLLNNVIGLFREIRARRTLDRLATLAASTVRVRRAGQTFDVPLDPMVQDDLIEVALGDKIVVAGPCVWQDVLKVDESLITGESDPISKQVGDNLTSGSFITAGRGIMQAEKIGAESFANQLSRSAKGFQLNPTPIQQKINAIVTLSVVGMAVFGPMLLVAGFAERILFRDTVRNVVVLVTTFVPQGLALATTLALVDALRNGTLNEAQQETVRNKIAKAERGKWVGSGATRYGYKRVGNGKDGRLIINEGQARIVRKVFKWYGQGASIRGIVKRLNDQGEVTLRGKKWSQSQIQEMLKSAEYTGQFHYCGIVTHFQELAIIDKRSFDDAQIRLKRNKELSRRNGRHEYLLTGVIRCADGHKLHGAALYKDDLYYYRHDRDVKCDRKSVRADVTDQLIWRWIISTLDDSLIERGLNRIAQRKAAELQPKCTRLAQVEKLIESIDGKIKRLVRDLSDEDDEILRAAVKTEAKNMTRQREGLAKDADALRVEIEQSEISQEMRERIKDTIREVRAKIDHATFVQRRFIINKLEVEVVVREDDAGRWLDVSWGLSETVNSIPIVKKILSLFA